MSGSGVPNDDMANYLRPRRQDTPQFSDAALGALLSGAEPPAPGLQPVADVLDALKSSPSRNELAGEAAALAEFRRGAQTRAPAHRSWAGLFTSRLSARAAAVAVAAVLGLGGFAGAAYAGILPGPIQRFAHDTINAPAPSAKPGAASPGTRLAGRRRHRAGAAHSRHPLPGLCAAYARASAHGTAAQRARALHNLASAAGGASKIPGYCRTGPVPGERRGQHQPHPPGEGKGHGSGPGNGKGGGQGNGHGPGQGDGNGHGPGHGDGNGPGHGNGNSQVNGNGGGQGNGQGPGSGHGQGPGNGNGSANGQGNGQHHGNAIGHGKGKAYGEAGGQSQGNQSAQRATVSPLRPRAQQSFTRHRTVTPRPQLGRVEPPHRSEGWRWQAVR